MYFTHGLFFTYTHKSHLYLQVTYLSICKYTINFQRKKVPCFNEVTPHYLESQLFVRGDKFPSTLVSGLVTTAPPLGFYPFHPFFSLEFILHYLCTYTNSAVLIPNNYTENKVRSKQLKNINWGTWSVLFIYEKSEVKIL